MIIHLPSGLTTFRSYINNSFPYAKLMLPNEQLIDCTCTLYFEGEYSFIMYSIAGVKNRLAHTCTCTCTNMLCIKLLMYLSSYNARPITLLYLAITGCATVSDQASSHLERTDCSF